MGLLSFSCQSLMLLDLPSHHYSERENEMPKGQYDRSKTKAQRDAEKVAAAGKKTKKPNKEAAIELAVRSIEKAFPSEQGKKVRQKRQPKTIETVSEALTAISALPVEKFYLLQNYLTCLVTNNASLNMGPVVSELQQTIQKEISATVRQLAMLRHTTFSSLSLPTFEEPTRISAAEVQAQQGMGQMKAFVPAAQVPGYIAPAEGTGQAPFPPRA
jgi:hypothetical protein